MHRPPVMDFVMLVLLVCAAAIAVGIIIVGRLL